MLLLLLLLYGYYYYYGYSTAILLLLYYTILLLLYGHHYTTTTTTTAAATAAAAIATPQDDVKTEPPSPRVQDDGKMEDLPTTTSEAGDASDESTTTCDDDLSEGFEEKTAVMDANDYWPWRRVDANGKDSWWPKRGHRSGHIFPNRSRSGPARGLTREELAGLREEARLAEYIAACSAADFGRMAVCIPLTFVE